MTDMPTSLPRSFLGTIAVSLCLPLLVGIFGLMYQLPPNSANQWIQMWLGFYSGLVLIVAYSQIREGRWKTSLALVASSSIFGLFVVVIAPLLLNLADAFNTPAANS